MADLPPPPISPAEEGFLRACEGILRAQFGRRPSRAAARALEQLEREFAPKVGTATGRQVSPWWERVVVNLRRPWFVSGALAALFAVAISLVLPGTRSKQMVLGNFEVVVGACRVQRAGERAVLEVSASSLVLAGDRIETGDSDKAEIRFHDGTTLRLGFNTGVEIRNSQLPLVRPSEIHLLRGQVWTQVQKLTNAPQYAIRTGAATAIARGTEFGVKLTRTANTAAQSGANLAAVLTVKEGVVDFTNALGSVRATAMTESTASEEAPPTEPRRLQTLQVVRLSNSVEWSILSSQLDWPDAAGRLALGGGWAGLRVRDFAVTGVTSNSTAGGTNQVRVTHVSAQSPAAMAGLRVGDMVVAVNGQPLEEVSQLSRAVLLRPGSELVLGLERDGGTESVTLTATNRAPLLPGPALSPAQAAQVETITRSWLDNGLASVGEKPAFRAEPVVEAAVQNNLGVMLEAEDAMGPSIRAYGHAVRAAPQVALYRFNLGLALRKIGSFERAAEELQAAASLAPDSVEARKRLAEVRSLLGDDAGALAQAEAGLQADPLDHGLWELKSRLLSKLGRSLDATTAARKAVETEPGCAVALRFLGGALYNEGNLAEAEQVYRKALTLAPFDPLLHHNLGSLLGHLGRLPEAEERLRKAIELQPDFVLAYCTLGDVLGNRRQWTEAEVAFKTASALDPEDTRVILDLGKLYFKQGRLSEAENVLRQAIEASPHVAQGYTGLADVLARRREFAQAEQAYRKVIELEPANPAGYADLAAFYRDSLRDLGKAEETYRAAIQAAPRSTTAYSGLARVKAMGGDLPEAERLLLQARDLEPSSSGIHNDLGEVLRAQGKMDQAAQAYRKALEMAPDSPSPYNNLGIIYATRGEFAEAEKMFRALVDMAAKNARLNPLNFLVNLAMVCDRQGKTADAEKFYRQALQLAPDDPGIWNSLAWFLGDHQINLDEALAFGRRAVQAEPDNFAFLDTLGWVLFQRGELDEAEKTLRKAIEAAGQNPSAAEIREHLKKVQAKKGPNEH